MHVASVAGRTKQFLLFRRASEILVKLCVALITEKFVNGHNYETVNICLCEVAFTKAANFRVKNYGKYDMGLTGLSLT